MTLRRYKTSSCAIVLVAALTGCSSSDNEGDTDGSQNSSTMRLVSNTINESEGSVVTISTEYRETGNLLSQVFQRDGNTFLTTTFESTADGEFVRRSEDTDDDGVENLFSTYQYTEGLGLVRINRHNSDGLINNVQVFSFEEGRAVLREVFTVEPAASSDLVDLSTGLLTTRRTFEYADGRLITNNIDSDADGEIDRREDFTYNPDGTLATTIITTLDTGATDTSTFVYEAGPCNSAWSNSSSSFFCVQVD